MVMPHCTGLGLGLGLGLGTGNGFYSFFSSALTNTLLGNTTCGVVSDVLRLSPCTEQPHPLGGSCGRVHETA